MIVSSFVRMMSLYVQYTEECFVNIIRVGAITMSDNETVEFNFINGENIWGSGTHITRE